MPPPNAYRWRGIVARRGPRHIVRYRIRGRTRPYRRVYPRSVSSGSTRSSGSSVRTVVPRRVPRPIVVRPTLSNVAALTYAQFQNRRFRQRPIVGLTNYRRQFPRNNLLDNNIMYRNQLTNYRSQMPRAKSATNRKNSKALIQKPKPAMKSREGLQRQIQELAKKVHISLSKHTYRFATAYQLTSNDGECDHGEYPTVTATRIEDYYLNNLRAYNPSAPGTLITADPSTATYSHDIKIKNIYTKLTFKNNNFVPVNLKVYLCKLKHDTATSVLDTYTNCIADQVISAGADTECPMIYLTDMERLKENWNIDCVIDKHLTQGQIATCGHGTGEFLYDPSEQDADDEYKVRNKYFVFVVRIQGDLSHDSTNTTTEFGIQACAIDIMEETKAEILYDAGGVQLNDIAFTDGRSAFTNVGITGLPSVPDNLAKTLT